MGCVGVCLKQKALSVEVKGGKQAVTKTFSVRVSALCVYAHLVQSPVVFAAGPDHTRSGCCS